LSDNELNIIDFIKLIFDIYEISIEINEQLPWLKDLINEIQPLYNILINQKNDLVKTFIADLKKFNISNNIKELFSADVDALDIDNLTEITDLITSISSYYDELTLKKKILTKTNIINFVHILLYIIVYAIKKDKFNDKDTKWIKLTISCLKFGNIIAPKTADKCCSVS